MTQKKNPPKGGKIWEERLFKVSCCANSQKSNNADTEQGLKGMSRGQLHVDMLFCCLDTGGTQSTFLQHF